MLISRTRAVIPVVLLAVAVLAASPCTAQEAASESRPEKTANQSAETNKRRVPRQTIEPTETDVRYGPYDRNLLDLYQAETSGPAPVLINFHGGGWVGGDKKGFNAAPYLQAGITVVSANYRLTTGTPDAAPYPAPMHDGARVVQFVRSRAKAWNIDPDRIALTGGSAGAVIDMWIAYHDDLADPDSDDPIERYSTRVTCLMPQAGPSTFDPDLILFRVGGPPTIHSCLLPFFDIESLEELKSGSKQDLMLDASPTTHVSSDDPPTFLRYPTPLGDTPLPAKTNVMYSIHHAEFGAIIKEKLDEAGVVNVLQVKGDGTPEQAGLEFLKKYLKAG